MYTVLPYARTNEGRSRAGLLNRLPRGAWPALGLVTAALVLVIAVVPFLTHGQQSGSSALFPASAPPRGTAQFAPSGPQPGSAADVAPKAFGLLPTPTLANPDQSTAQEGGVDVYVIFFRTLFDGKLPYACCAEEQIVIGISDKRTCRRGKALRTR